MEKSRFSKKKKIIAGIVVVLAVVVGLYFYFRDSKNTAENSFIVTKGEVISEVSVTGKVVPAKSIDLAFEKIGRISKVNVKVGSQVSEGFVLMQLENSDLVAQITQAEASVKIQDAKLNELKKGTRDEEIKVKEAELKKSQQDLSNYYKSIKDLLDDAYAKADDAVRTKTDDLFLNDDTMTPQLSFSVSKSQSEVDVVALRIRMTNELNTWRSELQGLSTDLPPEELTRKLTLGQNHLSVIREYLAKALDATDAAVAVSASTISSYKTNIYTGRTNVNTVSSNLNSQEQTIESQKITVQKIKDELALKLAGSTPEQITTQEAQLDEAKASVHYYKSQFSKTLLQSPFAGAVTKKNAEIGDIVSISAPVVSLIGSGKFEIEVNVAESDISKVKAGSKARVTLDAYGKGIIFDAEVVQIDLSETIIEGVATYKTKFRFLNDDERILSGLTADIDILSDRKDSVLYVPTRNITTKNGKQFVLKFSENDLIAEVEVTTGLRGSDGRTEIISGLNVGDRIVTE